MHNNTSTPKHPIKRLWIYGKRYQKRASSAVLFSILNKLFDLAPPALIGAAVDLIVRRESSVFASFGVTDLTHQLILLAVLTVLIWGLESAFEYLYATTWRNLAQSVQHDLRVDTYTHIQTLDASWFEERSTGGLMSILNDDVNQLERFLDDGANSMIQVATTVVAVGITFAYLAPSIAWITIVPIPLIIWGSFRFQSRIASRYADVRERVSDLNGQLSNNLSGITTIKSFTAEDHETQRIRSLSNAYQDSNRNTIRLSAAFVPIIRMVIVVGFTGTLVLGGKLALDGQLEVGTYSVLVFLTQRLLWPLTRLGQTFDLYQRAMASTTRVLDLLDTQTRIQHGETTLPNAAYNQDIALRDVSFAYPQRPPIFDALSLHFPASKTTAIVGPTGSGKSTVVRLLLRFHQPSSGSISIGEHPIESLTLHDLRKHIGLVSQSIFLFHGTIAENIAYGSFNATQDDIQQAAKRAEAHDFIMALPQGYDTLVGERGQKLSGGQRQRISIARAILKDPPILILDEATSAVDNETEAAIQRSMEHIRQGRTVIVIAHRLSTVRNADQIFVLHNGALCEQGTHDSLVAKPNGVYRRLWDVQTGSNPATTD